MAEGNDLKGNDLTQENKLTQTKTKVPNPERADLQPKGLNSGGLNPRNLPHEDLLIQFGNRVRTLRHGRGLSQEAMALECELDRTYVSGIERGRRNVSLYNIQKLAEVLNLSLSELFEGIKP